MRLALRVVSLAVRQWADVILEAGLDHPSRNGVHRLD
jgi:hypothetical protein